MKALLVLLASAGLTGCVAYDPGVYQGPSPYGVNGGGPYYGPYVVDPPGYYHSGPAVPYGYGGGYGYSDGYGHGSAYPGYRPHGPRPGRFDGRGDRPARPDPVSPDAGGSGWSPADIGGGGRGGGGGAPGGGGSGWSPNQR